MTLATETRRSKSVVKKGTETLTLCPQLLCGIYRCSTKLAFEKCGVFDAKLRFIQDYDLWFSFIRGNFLSCYLPITSGQTRIHKSRVTNTRNAIFIRERDMFYSSFFKSLSPFERKTYGFSSTEWLEIGRQCFRMSLFRSGNVACKRSLSESKSARFFIKCLAIYFFPCILAESGGYCFH